MGGGLVRVERYSQGYVTQKILSNLKQTINPAFGTYNTEDNPYNKYSSTIQSADLNVDGDFELDSGMSLAKEALHIKFSTFGVPEENKRILLLCPSMSNDVNAEIWWKGVIGYGEHFGIDLAKFFVIVGAPLGSPFGSTSPLSQNERGQVYGPSFPQITPHDQARYQNLLLTSLIGEERIDTVLGGSMGGMQAIQFFRDNSVKVNKLAAIAATGQTAPATVALRSVQRAAVQMDPNFQNGMYYRTPNTPYEGMRIARMFGTICYRSTNEFNQRFNWTPDEFNNFEVEKYLEYQADKFVHKSKYDPNCYLLNSKSMDMMDVDYKGLDVEAGKEALLLSYSTDKLTPPEDLERFSGALGKRGVRTHFEVLESKYGHDAFLIEREAPQLNFRLKSFLEGRAGNSVDSVGNLVKEFYHC
eukprot:augustus_masked-scaffold_40-processed-gene-1.6-mRNA-1 protein AED:0.27 eAED:0.28 QI:0/0/0/0.5/1/1/2/0/414